MRYIMIIAIFCIGSLFANDIEEISKQCNAKEGMACSYLGFLYNEGKGVKQDYFKAKELYEKACNLNNGRGCYNLSSLYYGGKGVKQDYFKAKELASKACDLGEQDGCETYRKFNERGY